MSRDLTIKPRAQLDIDQHAAYADDHYAVGGTRFLTELSHILDRLLTFPAFGQRWPSPNPAHQDIRRAILPTLPYSVFYRVPATAIEVVRVLHHAQDVPPILDDL